MTGTSVVALVFSKDELKKEQFTSIASEALRHVSDTGLNTSRFLNGDSQASTGRVFEAILPITKALTLRECKAITDSESLKALQTQHNVEIILQPQELYLLHKTPGLAVFDMDSTLIQQEVIDELARAVGLYDKVAAITEAAMRGEEPYTDFEASLRARVALLKGVPNSIWDQMKRDIITFTPGAADLITALKALGWKTAVLSGGFTPLANWVKETLGLDYAFANFLVADPALQQLTGELVQDAPIIHGQKKRELLLQLAQENGIPAQQIIAVGDGSNDLPMMDVAGLGVAFNAKPKVQLAAPTKLNSRSLLDVLYILGFNKEEIDQAVGASK